MYYFKRKSFTLVEMLIVVTIIGLLAVALVPKLLGAQQNARNKVRITTMNEMFSASKIFFSDRGYYPTSLIEVVSGNYLTKIQINPVCIETTQKYNPAWIPDTSWFAAAGITDMALFQQYCYTYYPEYHWRTSVVTPVVISKPQRAISMVILETSKGANSYYDYVDTGGANKQYIDLQYDLTWSTIAYGYGYADPDSEPQYTNCAPFTGSSYSYYPNIGSFATGVVDVYYIRYARP